MMTRVNTLRPVLLLTAAWLTLTPPGVRAQSSDCDGSKPVSNAAEAVAQVGALEQGGCLGGPKCDSPLCQRLKPVLGGGAPDPTLVAQSLRTLLDEAPVLGDENGDRTSLLVQMGRALTRFVDDGTTAAATWTLEELTLFKDSPQAIDIEAHLQKCATAAECSRASAHAQKVLELATLFGRVMVKATEGDRAEVARQLPLRDLRWRAYLGSSRGQYPWELFVNSWSYRKTAQFDAPPTSQLVLVHPSAALEFTRSASDRQPSESLVLELLGMYRWSWKEAEARRRLGGSLGVAWRDAGPDRQKLGYGVFLYLPRASTLGYVWRPQSHGGDEHALVVGADVAKFLRGTAGVKEKFTGGHGGDDIPK